MLGSIFSSSRSALSPEQTLDLANSYLEIARKTADLNIALVLCDDAEASLSQMKRAVRKAQAPQTQSDQTLRNKIAQAYFDRGQILDQLEQFDKAQDSYKKAEKWGHAQAPARVNPLPSSASDHSALFSRLSIGESNSPSLSKAFVSASVLPYVMASADLGLEGRGSERFFAPFFKKNVSTPVLEDTLPVTNKPPKNLEQLANGLILLSSQSNPDIEFSEQAQTWLAQIDPAEAKRLQNLATDVIRVFVKDELKEMSVAEVVVLAPGLTKELFNALLKRLVNGIERSTLLEADLLDGLAQMIRNAGPEYLDTDDLVKIVKVISERLQKTHGQSEDHVYRLMVALSSILDAMADYVQDVDRENLREPLLGYLKNLQGGDNPYLMYQAAYACQALAYVPDSETPWQGAVRRGSSLLKGVSGLISAVKGFDLNKIVDSLGDISDGVGGIGGVWDTAHEIYETVSSLAESGQDFVSCLQEGLTFERKGKWYKALEGADVLLQQRKLNDFEAFVRQATCRQHKAFQWGLSERLGQLAANPALDEETQQSALRFLGDLYENDAVWGQSVSAKKRVIQIIKELAIASNVAKEAKDLLEHLAKINDPRKRKLYISCQKDAAKGPEPLYKPALAPTSATLLDRAQNKPKVEDEVQQLRRARVNEWKKDERLYVEPLGKATLHDTATFDLTEKVNEFLRNPKKKILLLLGDSGAGKSTFNRALEASLWHSYLNDPKQKRIPLFIALPEIDNPTHELVEKHLHLKGFSQKQIRELKQSHEFVFILDSYDESQQSGNLYRTNEINQERGWQGQVIIGCRSEYFGEDDRARFQPQDATQLQALVVAPFSDQKIKRYTEAYAKVNPLGWSAEDYQAVLQSIPHLEELVTNPFLLRITLDVLPRLTNQGQELTKTRLTRLALYDEFVEQWFERGKQRFLTEKTLEAQEKKVFEELIDEGFTTNGIAFVKELAVQIYERQRGNPIVKYIRFEDQKTWKQEFFGPEDEKRLLREAWPLNRNKNQYQFIHKSLLEYFVARSVFEPGQSGTSVTEEKRSIDGVPNRARRLSFESDYSLDVRAVLEEKDLLDTLLARKNFVNEPAILGFLVERARKEPLFKKQLHALIERSKANDEDAARQVDKEAIRKAAANAITVLVKAGVQFNGADLNTIQIPGADLSGGVFDLAQLQRADLRKVSLRKSWLRGTNLSGAQMAGVRFGEWAYVQEKSEVYSCAYSPDGKTCAMGLENGIISLYDTSSWAKIHTLEGYTSYVYSVVYSPSGAQIAASNGGYTVRLWDAHSGAAGHILEGHTSWVTSVVYSPSGAQIASGSYDKTVRLWDAHSGAAIRTLEGHTDRVFSVVYSPSGAQIASGSYDTTVRLWDAESGAAVHTLEGHTDSVSSAVYSPSGAQIASSSYDTTVRLWDAESGAAVHTLEGHTDRVFSVVYSPSGAQIASSGDTTVRLWDAHSRKAVHTLEGHTDAVLSVVYSPSGAQIASSGDKTVRLWDAHSGTAGNTLEGHTWSVNNVVYSPSGAQIASGSFDKTVRLWDTHSGAAIRTLEGHTSWVHSVVYSPSGAQIASGSDDNTVRLWDAHSGAAGHILEGHAWSVNSVVYSPNGAQIASGSFDRTVRLWDAHSGAAGHILEGHASWVTSVVYSPSGVQIASGSMDKTVRLWDAHSGAAGYALEGHTDSVNSVAYSPSGAQIASGSDDKTVRLWDAHSGVAGHTLEGHTDSVNSVVYSPSGAQIASGSSDQTVRLWEAASGECLSVIQAFRKPVYSVAWTGLNEYQYLVSSGKGTMCQWEIKKEPEGYTVRLCWSSTRSEVLTVSDTLIEGVQGLSEMNRRLLKQRGAVGNSLPLNV
ncbi:MAG: WD40 repeat [Glomeribacter sp. 1016415]|nr:WD40 repeat [Glomeribacter sp. 1016415]